MRAPVPSQAFCSLAHGVVRARTRRSHRQHRQPAAAVALTHPDRPAARGGAHPDRRRASQDDFADLAEEEASLGNKADSDLREQASYYHLQYCAGRIISIIDWQPSTKGVVAVSCAQRLNFEEKVQVAGKVQTGYILLWNFSDPIHPQFVLEAPGDVYCFRFCPNNPDLVVGGVSSGQVCVWNLAEARDAARQLKQLTEDSSEEGGMQSITAQPTILSAVDQSQKRTITDLCWLPPSLEVTEKGKFVRKPVTGSGELNQFCTIAADGQILFWDLRKAAEVAEEKDKKEEKSYAQPEPEPKAHRSAAAPHFPLAAPYRRTAPPGGHTAGQREPCAEPAPRRRVSRSKKEGWGPTAKMTTSHPDGGGELGCAFGLLDVPDDVEGACRLFSVTEEGDFVTIDLLVPGMENFVKGVRSALPAHYGPCTALQRSPFVPKARSLPSPPPPPPLLLVTPLAP